MFITKKFIDRRTMLRGAGAAVARNADLEPDAGARGAL